MGTEVQECLSISTEDNDDVLAEPIQENGALSIPNAGNLSPEQLHLLQTFPWMIDFIKLSRSEIGMTNIGSLEKLMRFYLKQVSQSVKDCYSRPNRAAKLKRIMGDTLMFFHMTYSDFKPPLEHSSYLAKMSDLMAMYLDMEIKASRTGSESLPKIASKLTSSLHVYFGRSQEHILDTVLKSKIINKNFRELSDLIFRRVLRDSPGSSVYIFSYIRYILAFKMWKGIMKEIEERKKISQLAIVKLTPPPCFREKMSSGILRDILPRVPRSRTDVTAFLMQAKFSVRDKIKMFLRAAQDPKLHCAVERHVFKPSFTFPADQEESESNTLMNDIWSSMNNESAGMRDSTCGNLGKAEKIRKLKNIGKLKVENSKRRRRKIEIVDEIGEDDKPIIDTVILDDDVSFIKVEVEEAPSLNFQTETPLPATREPEAQLQPPPQPQFQPQLEPEPEPEPSMEIAAEVELPANLTTGHEDTSVKIETLLSYSKENPIKNNPWNEADLQSYYNNVSFDYLGDIPKDTDYIVVTDQLANCDLHHEVYQVLQEDTEHIDIVGDNLDIDKVSTPTVEVVVPSSHFIEQEDELEIANATTKDETEGDKVSKDQNGGSLTLNQLHICTSENDRKIYDFQMKVHTYSSRHNVRSWISILSSFFSEQSKTKIYRCICSGCKTNLSVLRKNWRVVFSPILHSESAGEDLKNVDENGLPQENSTEELKIIIYSENSDRLYSDAAFDDLFRRLDDTGKEESESCNLPLKKRKAFSYSNNAVKEDRPEVSYPPTPMISIAEMLHGKYYNSSGMAHSQDNAMVSNYMAPFGSAQVYPNVNSVIVQSTGKVIASEPCIVPEQALVPGAFTTTFLPVSQEQELGLRRRFKTPAQLKEFQHLSAAQDLINFANTSRTYRKRCASLSPPLSPPPPRRTRKQTRKSRKRKS